jgi:hypothetical protein
VIGQEPLDVRDGEPHVTDGIHQFLFAAAELSSPVVPLMASCEVDEERAGSVGCHCVPGKQKRVMRGRL